MSDDVIAASEGRLALDRAIANYRRRHRRRHHRRPRNDSQSRSDFRINLVIRAHTLLVFGHASRVCTSAHR